MDLFAHRIHNAEYVNGVVRLECSVVRPDEKGEYHPNEPAKPGDTTFTVNLPVQGFMRSLGAMRELAKKLQDDGVIKGREGGGRPGGPPGEGRGPGQGGGRQLEDLSEQDRSDDDDHLV